MWAALRKTAARKPGAALLVALMLVQIGADPANAAPRNATAVLAGRCARYLLLKLRVRQVDRPAVVAPWAAQLVRHRHGVNKIADATVENLIGDAAAAFAANAPSQVHLPFRARVFGWIPSAHAAVARLAVALVVAPRPTLDALAPLFARKDERAVEQRNRAFVDQHDVAVAPTSEIGTPSPGYGIHANLRANVIAVAPTETDVMIAVS